MMQRYRFPGIALALMLMSNSAFALQEGRWYGGAAAGMSSADISRSDWDDGSITSGSVENSGLSFDVFAGYGFSRRLGIEVDYWRIADTDFNGVSSGAFPSVWVPGPVAGKTHAQGLNTTAVAAWPATSRLSVFAKGGLLFWDTTIKYFPTVTSQISLENTQITEINDNGVSLIYGIGVDYRVRGPWWVRAALTQGRVGLARTNDFTVNYLSLGVLVNFR